MKGHTVHKAAAWEVISLQSNGKIKLKRKERCRGGEGDEFVLIKWNLINFKHYRFYITFSKVIKQFYLRFTKGILNR